MGLKKPTLNASLQFIGATKTVTGSKTILTVGDQKILIDCGLFQGPKAIRAKNWEAFENASELCAVFLTHAHIDHSGYLPKLIKEGFSGPIYCSFPTVDLCNILLRDAAHLQEEDAFFANSTKYSNHEPALPLYTTEDAIEACKHLKPLSDDVWHDLFENISVRLTRSSHILGSRYLSFAISDGYKRMICTFSGDIGNGRSYILKDSKILNESDIVIMEATYGDRLQDRSDPLDKLAKIINDVYTRDGVLVIPAFSVGRTQEILYMINSLKEDKKIPNIDTFVDSPMSINTTEVYNKYEDELKVLDFSKFQYSPLNAKTSFKPVPSSVDSNLLCAKDGPFIVLSAAGMLTGGRILHHLKRRLPDAKNCVLFVGYQAEETKGRLLQEGIKKIRIHHEEIPINCKILTLNALSAHGDQNDLMEWVTRFKDVKTVFINHGEENGISALRDKIRLTMKVDVIVPSSLEIFQIF